MPGDILDPNNPEGIFPVLARLENQLGLPAKFSDAFKAEDDWSFVIKLHALLEAALTSSLVSKLGHPELERVLSNLSTSSAETGKVEFAHAVGLLNKDERRTIRRLSRLRNDVALSIRNVNLDLRTYVNELDSKEQIEFVRCFAAWDGVKETPSLISRVLEDPKFFLWQTGLIVTTTLRMQGELSEARREGNEQLLESLRRLVALQVGLALSIPPPPPLTSTS